MKIWLKAEKLYVMKMREVAKFLTVTFFLAFCFHNAKAQTISPVFFGVNAWMPDTIGDVNNCTEPPCIRYGKLHKNWKKVGDSKATSVRYGGIGPDRNISTKYQFLKMVDSIRARGMEPIIQVPFWDYRYNPSHAAEVVQFLNVTKGRNVKYWIIGNEPNYKYGYTTSAQIAAYYKPFASAMKAVDPSIKIVGPETAAFKKTISDGLTNPGGPDDITGTDAAGRYYLDVFTFHTYPFSNASTTLPTRSQLISKLTLTGGYQDDIAYMNARLAAANAYHGRTGSNVLKLGITEANVVHTNHPTDNLYGVGANSFLGGQFVAEMYGIGLKQGLEFINLWSVIEGGGSVEDNCGYIDPLTGNKKPVYYHFQMMADNFKGSSVNCTDNQLNVKAFASKSSQQISVMIMNQDQSVNHPLAVRLNTTAITSTTSLNINVNANVNVTYTDNIPNQSTILLTFNSAGTLIKKCVYSMSVQAAANQPPSCVEILSPDLTITSNSVSQSVVLPGASVTASTSLKNAGTGTVTSGVSYYLSTDNVFNTGDVLLATTNFSPLATGVVQQKQTVLNIPATAAAGNYFILHVADALNSITELNETNNAMSNALAINTATHHDVSSLSPASSASATVQGGTLTLNFTIKNSGTSTVSLVNNGYYLSTDASWSSSDLLLSSQNSGSLAPGAVFVSTKTVVIPSSLAGGQYYLLYVSDNTNSLAESDENNNIAFKALAVGNNIDLALTAASLSSSSVVAGNTITANCTVKNLGANVSAASSIGFYLSSDTIFDANDTELNNVSVASLAVSGSATKTSSLIIPHSILSGDYYILFFADKSNLLSETNELNNLRAMNLKIQALATGIESEQANLVLRGINVYPNPTSGPLSIELEQSNDGEQEYLLELYDITGNRVMNRPMIFLDNKLEFIIPENLNKGIYILSVSTGQKKITRKIILNR